MPLNQTPSGERTHIAFFGRRNAGKSSLLNAVTNQDIAVVSDKKGTTTDPVYKAMELLPLGPVMLIDTPGIDDEGTLGEKRVKKAKQVLNKTDVAVLVCDGSEKLSEPDRELVRIFEEKSVPFIIVFNKSDLLNNQKNLKENELFVSAKTGENIEKLKEKLASFAVKNEKKIVADLIEKGDTVVLVTPIDSAAPKGRLILPQQQTIRDVLDAQAAGFVTREDGLESVLNSLRQKPKMVITDSQVFEKVSKIVPNDILLTSFSILMARYKGFLDCAVKGVAKIPSLRDGDTVLISEGCTHHRQCGDIGTQKLPKWLCDFTKRELNFEFSSGTGFPEDLTKYDLIIHCGGCMLNEREMTYRMNCAIDQNVPFTNYGVTIACLNKILKRSLEIFPDLAEMV
ncbi:MAG: [Clostridia bacterium]|nr:[FeFe] hydrogenase H-cluster maturation GTPase HydF [Clostridia bacterium]